jgi:hypothetical protein
MHRKGSLGQLFVNSPCYLSHMDGNICGKADVTSIASSHSSDCEVFWVRRRIVSYKCSDVSLVAGFLTQLTLRP